MPQVAQPAIQGGKHVAEQIALAAQRVTNAVPVPGQGFDGDDRPPRGGRRAAGRRPALGTVGWFAWLGLHLMYLVGFRNRLNVFVNWAWNYLTYDRASADPLRG
ncbi:MAG: hypothetical protein R2705_23685 [Ilumatobacteraceae bacterium]